MAHECAAHRVPAFGFRACYGCLKIWARRGELLSPEELAFVGLYEPRRSRGGWHDPNHLVRQYELDDREELSAEDSTMLQALMSHPSADQLEFVNADWF